MIELPNEVPLNLPEQVQIMRAVVEFAATSAAAGVRVCPECGMQVYVTTGRRTEDSWFVHAATSDCINDSIERRIKFSKTENKTSREVALAAEKIFYES